MRSIFVYLSLTGLSLIVACSSPGPARPQTQAQAHVAALPDCETTNGYPPCAYYDGPAAYEGGGYDGGGDYYSAYDSPYYPGTGVVVVPEPVLVPTPPNPAPRPPPKHPKPPPPKHFRRGIPNPCHPAPGQRCP
jgi:hypothetical protein